MSQQGKEFQFSLFNMKNKKIFGGALLKKSNAKEKRPISTKHAMHIVIRSNHARGKQNFLTKTNKAAIDRILKKQAKIRGIRLYRYENVGNHLHILLKTGHRKWLCGYLRAVTGLIARQVLGVERGQGKGIQFWDARPFSRVVAWGRDYNNVKKYFKKNQLQAMGFSLNRLEKDLAGLQPDSS